MQLDDLGHTDATFISALGIQIGSTRIAADATTDGALRVEVNGAAVNMVNTSGVVYDANGCVVMVQATEDTFAMTAKVRRCAMPVLMYSHTVFAQSDSLFIAVSKQRDAKHLDVDVTLLQAMAMEGVLVRVNGTWLATLCVTAGSDGLVEWGGGIQGGRG